MIGIGYRIMELPEEETIILISGTAITFRHRLIIIDSKRDLIMFNPGIIPIRVLTNGAMIKIRHGIGMYLREIIISHQIMEARQGHLIGEMTFRSRSQRITIAEVVLKEGRAIKVLKTGRLTDPSRKVSKWNAGRTTISRVSLIAGSNSPSNNRSHANMKIAVAEIISREEVEVTIIEVGATITKEEGMAGDFEKDDRKLLLINYLAG